jgi:hypothetical protein
MKPNHDEVGVDAKEDLRLRVSVATYNRVIFSHPQDGRVMLALERKATVLNDGSVSVRAQPFGGAVRILNATPLQEIIGKIKYDSERSQHEGDFRILIPPSKWEMVKQYCLQHLENPADFELESLPQRELVEEFEETLRVNLRADQYTVKPAGFVVENNPVHTENTYARGMATVRLYVIFEVHIVDSALCNIVLATSQYYSDHDLGLLALKNSQNGGAARANSILSLPLDMVDDCYLAFPPEMRYRKIMVENHELDESVLAILEGIETPQYQRIRATI